MLGNLKNAGKTYHKSKSPVEVTTHDFPSKELGKDYETKKQVTDVDLNQVNIVSNKFHGEWNYEIRPNCNPKLR